MAIGCKKALRGYLTAAAELHTLPIEMFSLFGLLLDIAKFMKVRSSKRGQLLIFEVPA